MTTEVLASISQEYDSIHMITTRKQYVGELLLDQADNYMVTKGFQHSLMESPVHGLTSCHSPSNYCLCHNAVMPSLKSLCVGA